MRILDFADGFESETAPTQGTTTTTQLATFANDAAFVTSKGSTASSGDMYFNTTSNTGRLYNGSNWVQIFNYNSDGTLTFTGDATFNGDSTFDQNVTITGNLTVNGTTVTLNTTTWEVEDTNITLNNGGDQSTADDTAGITIEMSDATDAVIKYDKDKASKWKLGEDGSEEEVLTSGHTQEISDKTFTDELRLTELASTPSTPSSGEKKLYPKNDGKVYTLDSDGNEVEVGSGGGTGSKNYYDSDSADFATSIGNWETDDGAGSVASYLTISRTEDAAEVLGEEGSLSVAKSANDASGEYIKLVSQTIHRVDRGKTLFGSFAMDCTDANYASGDFILEFVDQDGNTLYSGKEEDLELLATKQTFNYFVDTDSDTTTIEIRLKVNSTNANAYELFFDEFRVGPVAKLNSPIVTEWQEFTVSSTWSGSANVSETGFYRRVGDSMEIELRADFTGAPPSSSYLVTIPDGKLYDDSKSSSFPFLGAAYLQDVSPANRTMGKVYPDSSSQLGILCIGASVVNQINPFTWAASDTLGFKATIPIEGWSTGTTMTDNELSLQSIEAQAKRTTVQSLTHNTLTKVQLDATEYDDFSIVDTTNNRVVIPKTGKYTFNIFAFFDSNGTGTRTALLWNNTTSSYIIPSQAIENAATASSHLMSHSYTGKFTKGHEIEMHVRQTSGSALDLREGWLTVQGHQDTRVIGATRNFEILSADSPAKISPATANWLEMTDNSVTLTPGIWELTGNIFATSATNSQPLDVVWCRWSESNGTDTASAPSGLSLSYVGRGETRVQAAQTGNFRVLDMPVNSVIVTVTETTEIFLVPVLYYSSGGTTHQVEVQAIAKRLK